MAKLRNFNINVNLISEGNIISYESKMHLTSNEYQKLPKCLQKKFKPIYEKYKVRYIYE